MGSHISVDHASRSAAAKKVLDATRRLVRMLRALSRESEQRAGLNAAQLFVLSQLEAGKGLSIGELAERTLTHQSSVSVVVQRLVDAGLVRRVGVAADRRRVHVQLTAEGRARLSDAPDVAQERLLRAIAEMRESERVALVTGLSALVAKLGLASEPAGMLFSTEELPTQPARGKAKPRRVK